VSRFALHRQGQNSQVCPRWHGRPCHALVLPKRAGLGYRRAGLKAQPSTDRRKRFLPAGSDQVFTLGVREPCWRTGAGEPVRTVSRSHMVAPVMSRRAVLA
jgi:hypothetical protein